MPKVESFYIHKLNPIAFTLLGLDFPWYWLTYLVGLFWVLLYGSFIIHHHSSPLKVYDFKFQLFFAWPAVFLGGRLFYVFVYNWNFFKERPELIIQLWYGGMSFHGALLALILSAWAVSKFLKNSLLSYLDVLATAAPLTLFFGRIANFINGELAGRPTELPWAVIFPRYEDGLPRHPSQIYQALTEGLLLFIILNITAKKNISRPGLQSALFLMGYGASRFFIEFFREPDAQLGTWLYLSMGQYLCLLMIFAGLTLYKVKTNDR